MIDRKSLVRRHNPILHKPEPESALAVGNGEFAFTADITGFQSLYDEYLGAHIPLCTMSRWGWHTEPCSNERGFYTLDDIEMTRYNSGGRSYGYAVDCMPGNEEIYNWLRHNPHRLNLARISLLWDGETISGKDITNIRQELDLFTGVLQSEFELFGHRVFVQTAVAKNEDVVGFSVRSSAIDNGLLTAGVFFPYGCHRMVASDWQNDEKHVTEILDSTRNNVLVKRTLDHDGYFVRIGGAEISRTGAHSFMLSGGDGKLDFTVCFSPQKNDSYRTVEEVFSDSTEGWAKFWQGGGAADFSASSDPRAGELERRTVLSQYLTAVHCAGSLPPQETGLACNSWYGKFHLEMHILHSGWLPLWGHGELLEKSFDWYRNILGKAKSNAARNGFKGARWPKMSGPEGSDSPSRIATLLIWQQPHILYMLELVRRSKPEQEQIAFMREYWDIVSETADFMCDFAQLNQNTGLYDLPPPLIPAQETHSPETTVNPAFELCYWRFGIELASGWAKILEKPCDQWERVIKNMAAPSVSEGLYLAHRDCPDTFERFNRDHPSMLFGFGFIPYDRIDRNVMSNTADKVLGCWDFDTAWGWDFALMAMTFTRLGRPDAAIDILLKDAAKNTFTASGNNYQRGRDDLPLYLPGNGSLLFALPMMLAGYGETRDMPGLPKNGMWNVTFEGLSPLPY